MKIDPPLTGCPHCGADEFYVRIQVTGTITERHRFDGERTDNTGMWDSVQTRQRKTVYCNGCDKRIAVAV